MSSQGRKPRYVVKIGGKLTLPLSLQTVNNAHFQCDTFSVGLEAWGQPDGFGLDYWDGAGDTQVEILFGTLGQDDDPDAIPSDLSSLLIGNVDDVDVNLDSGRLTITGRDLTARFIDTKVAQTWPDHTASQIVEDLCGQVGITPNITATKTPVGKYQNGAYAAQRRDIPMWDLITFLAEQEGFDAFVTGSTLYFGPPLADSKQPLTITVQPPTTGSPGVNVSTETLKLHRSLTLAKDIAVTVLSYDAGKKAPIKAVARRQGSQKTGSTSFRTGKTSQNYVIRRAGLTQQQAVDLAQKTLADLSKHERTLEFSDVPNGDLTSRTKATVTGTNTGWDTEYFIDTVTRTYQSEGGNFSHSMSVTAKNHQVESQPDA
jgi:phage protein D